MVSGPTLFLAADAALSLQEPERQSPFKLSYYLAPPSGLEVWLTVLERRLAPELERKVVSKVADQLARKGWVRFEKVVLESDELLTGRGDDRPRPERLPPSGTYK